MGPWAPTAQTNPAPWSPTAQAEPSEPWPAYPEAAPSRTRAARRGLQPWLWAVFGFVAVLLIAFIASAFFWEGNPLRSLLGARGPEYIAFLDEDYNVAIVLPDGSGQKALTDDGDEVEYHRLAWSPDHRSLAAFRVDRDRDEPGLWIGRPDGGEAQTIKLDLQLNCAELERCLDWSPNGQKLAIVGQDLDSGTWLLVVADVKTGEAEAIAKEDDKTFLSVAWFPSDHRLAVTVGEKSGSEAYIETMRDDGSDAERMTVENERELVGLPIFSSKAGRMAYITHDPSSATTRLYVSNIDGSDAKRIAKALGVVPLNWSRDGSRLLYYNHEDEELLVYDVRSGDEYKVASSDGDLFAHFSAALSFDGKSVAYYNIEDELMLFDLETKDRDRVVKFAVHSVAW